MKRFFLAVLPPVAAILLSSCQFFDVEEAIEVHPPTLPAAYQEALGAGYWYITVSDGAGLLHKELVGSGKKTVIQFRKGRWSAIFASFSSPRGQLAPAGALYPLDLAGGTINLSFRHGFDASLGLHALLRGHEIASFNWERFRLERARESEDPWLLDPDAIASQFYREAFRSTVIRKSPWPRLILPGCEGFYLTDNPELESRKPTPSGEMELLIPRRGLTLFGAHETIRVALDRDDTPVPIRLSWD